jgi:hypothetical protein
LQTKKAAYRGDNRSLYKITKELAGRQKNQEKVNLDKNEKILVSNDHKLKGEERFSMNY